VTAALAGCGGSGGGTTPTTPTTPAPAPAPTTALARALAPIVDGPVARAGVRYGDEAALRQLAHAPSSVTRLGTTQLDQRWFGLVGFGAPLFVASAPQLPDVAGLDLFAADRAVTAGRPPRTVTRLDGARLDTSAIAAALRKLGARPAGDVLAIGRDGAVHVGGPLGRIGIVSAFDRVIARPGTLVAGAYADTLPDVLGGGRSIAADPEWTAAIRCLGDVVAASIAPSGGGLRALGVVRPAPHPRAVTERVCVIGGAPPLALLRRAPGVASVAANGEQATLTLDPSEPAGLVFKRLDSGG
jgi:hypothetical protein